MQVPDIEARVQAITGLPAAHPRLTSTTIQNLWWEGAVRMVREARPGYLRKTATQNLPADGAVLLPVDCLILLRVRGLQSGVWGTITKKTQEELDELYYNWENLSPPACHYYDSGIYSTTDADYGRRKVQLTPAPGNAVTNGLELRYIRQPIHPSISPNSYEYIDIPADYHEGVCNYAAWRFLQNFSENPRQDVDKLFQVFQADVQSFQRHCQEDMEYDHEPVARLPVAGNSLSYWSSL